MSLRWPEVGEKYRSRDPRDDGLVITVLEVDLDAGKVVIQRFRKTRVAIHRFRKDYAPLAAAGLVDHRDGG